ncbi:MAG: ArsR/SmtB family transcription factor [Lutisporaceae bacterium]|jgi:ArsR family transcriptional regulator
MKNEYIRVFRAFTDESRVRILEILSEGEQCACILLDDLKISQPTLSHHMKILCDSGIVKSRRVGKWNYYSINTDGCEYAGRILNAIVKHNMEGMLRIVRYVYSFLRHTGTLPRQKAAVETNSTCACCCVQNN